MELRPWLIQRAFFLDRKGRKGIDSILQFDYMGSAEFEFGALGESLSRIRGRLDDYTSNTFWIGDRKEIHIFYPNNIDTTDILVYLRELGVGEIRLKERSDFDTYVNPEDAMFPNRTDFWWDIDNDIMFWKNDPEPGGFNEKFRNAISID